MSYTYEEAYQDSLHYFNGNELSAKIFCDKYVLRDNDGNLLEKNPDEMHRRLTSEFARVEKKKFKNPLSEAQIHSYLKNFERILPQGSPMFGIGNHHQYVSLSNCYVVPCYDSYGGIVELDQNIVQISKRRGGIGYDISPLRPANFTVCNAAHTTTGATSFMHRFSNSGREVGQGGRRAAQMITISVHHPDIMDFIKIKADKVSVTGANISVRITDEFLKAVEKDEDYELRWPVNSKTPKVSKKTNARAVWKEIIHYAWLRAEPGILFWDNIIRESPADCYSDVGFETTSTNPCQPGWAKVLTQYGIRELNYVNIGDSVWSKDGWVRVENKVSNGIKKVFKYITTAGIFYGTENHRLVSNGEKIEAKFCESIDILTGPEVKHSSIIPEWVMDGLVFGDGYCHKASNDLIVLSIGKDDQDYFDSEVANLIKEKRNGIGPTAYEINTNISHKELPKTYLRKIPARYITASINHKCSFLRGLYSANGSVCGNRITLKASSFDVVEDVQLILSSLGIRSYFTTNKPKMVEFENGIYECRESYDLNISTDRDKFVKLIGFIQKYKIQKLKEVTTNRIKETFDIISIQEVGDEEVFDITVDGKSHTYWTQGCDVSNCGEIPLCPFDSCRLTAMNLYTYVKNPFTKEAYFDYEEFYKDVQVAQRLMDNLIDLEIECLTRIINKVKDDPEPDYIKASELNLWTQMLQKCQQGRRTGLGITALGDTLAALGLKYGSEESICVAEKIYTVLKLGAYRSSVDMAKELGAFPVWNYEKEKDNPFLNRLKDDKFDFVDGAEIYADMKKWGRRNIALLTTAPTGTLSIVTKIGEEFNTTSGIEPAFLTHYTRRKKGNPGDNDFRVDFKDESGDCWMEFPVFHSGVKEWMRITGKTDIKESPYYGACANDINWKNRVKLQARANRHIDHSISSTLNVPTDIKEEQIAEIYETAWKEGVKGITVYRDKCRDGVLVDKEEEVFNHAPKRPKSLPCDIYKVKGSFIIIGKLDNKPYECFLGKFDKHMKDEVHGELTKIKRGHYQLLCDGEVIVDNVCGLINHEEEIITRLVSTNLRHGISVEFVVSQLLNNSGDMSSTYKTLARVLKKYIKEGTKITGDECPTCKGQLIYSEGCKTCKQCGYSACN